MSILSRALLILALLAVSTMARSDGISNIGNLNSGFTGGLANFGVAASAPIGCASPTAPDGTMDLSECSNAFYAAVAF